MSNSIEHADWKIHWKVTEASGLIIYLASYKKRRVMWEGSLPYVTVDHQREVLSIDEESGGEVHGPFWAPLGFRNLVGAIRRSDFRGGFELAADFSVGQGGPFRFTQLWRFHKDGRMAPWLVIHGPGLHDSHTYHPHWRFDFDIDGASDDALEHFEGGRWSRVAEEGWLPYTGESAENATVWRQIDFGTGAEVAIRPHHWEDAELFAIRYHDAEWPPYSPRAAASGQTFPAGYTGDESIDGEDVCLWYVAHVHHDAAFPFTAGPWIRCSF